MGDAKLDPNVPPGLHLISAFLAMDPTGTLISLARACGGGLVTETVQRFIWEFCISKTTDKGNTPYLKNFVKKLICEIESSHGTIVLDELYEQYGYYVTSLKDDISGARVCKCISFLFPDGCSSSPICPKSRKLVVPLHCSLNMLEGDTGCSVWPSSLYLSEFVLSFPDIFSNKTCFEVGSGVGLVGVCLSHVKASKVILSDGDLSTLANMKFNLELNESSVDTGMPERTMQDQNRVKAEMDKVKCIHLPWESATRNELQEFMPDIVLGADIIYDPSCLPYLVQVLAILLKQTRAHSQMPEENCQGSLLDNNRADIKVKDGDESNCKADKNGCGSDLRLVDGSSDAAPRKGPVAYIASVIRNIDTFNCFLGLAEQANLSVRDITEKRRPFDLLPYMQSYNRSSIRLFCVAGK
ncbi:protein-lysine N-methyltransferase EEF2KMT [Ricinus communis]|uniref:FAM86 N-terminal domain-containing protein n=1 Tax=Ricinus communis TaxID=3988 RepID=B9RF21_RICCO|nr:protein-lysine N-methyltransferase EEF2KMT [Ricinus communis]EEF49792.1 conserved hypothetical protein [Ricinus communis]|eukprot:XP_002512340.1 protein-lysine N-methyltransferase EEF2KMT isoform X2 [Ricinus communis]